MTFDEWYDKEIGKDYEYDFYSLTNLKKAFEAGQAELEQRKAKWQEQVQKANEWHYMKDVNCYEDLRFPPEEEWKGKLLIWKVQVITEKGVKKPVCYHCGSYNDLWYEINAYHVIAWKEIVLPTKEE